MSSSTDTEQNPENAPVVAHHDQPTHFVGVGASAGGLEALVQFFAEMPRNTGYAFVVVQHLSPDFKSVMDELLSRHTDIPIFLVEDRVEVKANVIYLIPPKTEIVLYGGRLLLTDKDPKSLSLPIDVFFRSLAQEASDRAVAIVLSGTGSDGSRGIVDVHNAGGLVLVQSEETAKFNGMPRSATNTGMVDEVLSPDKMPRRLLKHTNSPLLADDPESEDENELSTLNDHYMAIFRQLRESFKTDFTFYKPTTINRRIERRMASHKCETLVEYIEILEKDPSEPRLLYQDLLIGVTRFFRDPEAFDSLKSEVIPEMIASKKSGDQIRIWVPSCSTGEEAYTIAMLFTLALEKTDKTLDLKIFATDLDGDAVNKAASGLYPAESMEQIDPELVSRFFCANGDLFQVDASLRKMIVFAEQNLLKDPPFTKIDLVSCRNFLIYLQPIAQKKVFTMFLFSLNVGGLLFLGPSESLGDLESEFDTVDRHWNIMRKRRDVRVSPIVSLPSYPTSNRSSKTSQPVDSKYGSERRKSAETELYQAYDELLSLHIPPSFLVDTDGNLVHVFGDSGKYLKGVRGRASLDLLSQVDGNLRLAVSTALQRVAKDRSSFSLSNIPIENPGADRYYVDITAIPLLDRRYVVIQLDEHAPATSAPVSDSGHDFDVTEETQGRISDLEKELQFSRENLQATIEELETSNEELQATNEELLASNEELQSTNEELQSVNEELFTVNTEYEKKNQELTQLNNDIDNLLKSTEIGTVFIDSKLCIRKYTPAIAETFNLLPMDIGRPFEHITVNIVDQPSIVSQVKQVIETRQPIIREVLDRSGTWQLMRIFPYLTASPEPAGAVLTLVDITSIKVTERELKRSTASLVAAKENLEQFAYSASHDLQTPLRAVSGFLDLLRKRYEDADEETLEYLDYAANGAFKMKEMINGLLAYTRVETRAKPFELFPLIDAIEEATDASKDKIKNCGATIKVSGCEVDVFGERAQLACVFTNLIDNSLKFRGSETPKISINADRADGNLHITFRDNGIGIAPVNIKDVQKLFYREHPEGKYEGLGLGLTVCNRIALKHAGDLKVESDPGLGTTVHLTLPLHEVAELADLTAKSIE